MNSKEWWLHAAEGLDYCMDPLLDLDLMGVNELFGTFIYISSHVF